MKKWSDTNKYLLMLAVLLILLIFTMLIGISVGSVQIEPKNIPELLIEAMTCGGASAAGNAEGKAAALAGNGQTLSAEAVILWNIRLPRVLLSVLLGGALAVSGYLLQLFFCNPIAGPYVLGISSGARLVVAIVMISFVGAGIPIGSGAMAAAAFAGSIMSMLIVLAVSERVKSMSVLVVCGVMIGYVCSAVTEFILLLSKDSYIVNLHYWSQGSFAGSSWENVKLALLIIVPSMAAAMLLSKSMRTYQLGEIYAENAGVNIRRFRILLILLSSLLSASVTALAGPISFVGVAAPHLIRRSFKTNRPAVMLPACFLGGAVFTALCDLAARTLLAPQELSISSITACIGAPVVILLMLGKGRRDV